MVEKYNNKKYIEFFYCFYYKMEFTSFLHTLFSAFDNVFWAEMESDDDDENRIDLDSIV